MLARLADNPVPLELLETVLTRVSLVAIGCMHHDECGADHHRIIPTAIKSRDRKAALAAMEHHLTDLESRLRLGQAQDDSHTFAAILQRFSSRG